MIWAVGVPDRPHDNLRDALRLQSYGEERERGVLVKKNSSDGPREIREQGVVAETFPINIVRRTL